MKRASLLAAGVFAASVATLLLLPRWFPAFDLAVVYAKVQMPFFTGFLTTSSFLLSLKTFILLRLKQNIYDTKSYEKTVRDMQALRPSLAYYGPLSRLSDALVFAVLLTLTCSLSQVTLGFVPGVYTAAICFSLAAAALAVVLLCWWYIRQNLKFWFETIEKEKATSLPKP